MSELYNTSTRKPDSLPEDQIGDAIVSGTHSYAAGTQVHVNTPDGDDGTVSAEQLSDALKQGYTLRTAKQQAVQEYVDENKGLKGSVKQALWSFGNQAAFGIPEIVRNKTQDPFEVAKAEALAKDHALSEAVGGISGFAGSLFLGGPLFKGAATAAEVSERVVAEQLAAHGLEAGSKNVAKSLAAKIATKATGMGTEGVVIAAPRAVTEAVLGDPEAAGESLLMGGVIGAGLGTAGALVGTPLKALGGYAAKKAGLTKAAEAAAVPGLESAAVEGAAAEGAESAGASAAVPGAEPELGTTAEAEITKSANPYADPNDQSLLNAAQEQGATDGTLKTLLDGLKKRKDNASEIIEANRKIGNTDILEGSVSASPHIQDLHSEIMNMPTPTGIAQRQRLTNTIEKVSSGIENAIGGESNLTARDTGDLVKQGLIDKFKAKMEVYKAHYQAAGITDSALVGDGFHEQLIKELKNIEGVSVLKNSPDRQLVNQFIEQVPDIKTIGHVEDFIKSARSNNITDPNLGRIAGKIKAIFEDAKDAAIEDLTNTRVGLEGGGSAGLSAKGKQVFTDAQAELKAAKASYREVRQEADEVFAALGRAKGGSPSSLESFLNENLSSEDVTRKLFTKGDSRFLDFFKEKFPQEYDTLMGHHRAQLLNDSMRDGVVLPGKVFQKMSKVSPELQAHLFKDPELYNASRTVYESLPKQINPSGTDKANAYRSLFSIDGAMEAAKTFGQMQIVRSAANTEGLLATEQAMKKTAMGFDKIPGVIDAMEKGIKKVENKDSKAIDAIYRLVENAKDPKEAYRALSKKIADSKSSPNGHADTPAGAVAANLSAQGAPNISQAFTIKMQQALNHMDEILPKPVGISNPLNPREFHPSDKEMSEFKRRLAIMIDPMSALDDLQSGKLTQGQMHTLQAVYPKVYAQMQQRVLSHLSETQPKLNYQARLKLSMFLGTSLDPSLSPQTIQGYQSRFQQPNAQQPTPTKLELGLPGMTSLRGAKNKGT